MPASSLAPKVESEMSTSSKLNTTTPRAEPSLEERGSTAERSPSADPPCPWWAALLASATVLALKAPDALIHPQFFAEDGVIFFADEWRVPWPLLDPYAHYLHVIPRLVAKFATLFSVAHAPAIYNYCTWILASLALASLRHLRLGPLPFGVLLAGVALTPTSGEVFGTLTGLQWFLLFYQVSFLSRFALGDPSSAPLARALIGLLVGLTGPFSIFVALAATAIMAISMAQQRWAPDRPTSIRPTLEWACLSLSAAIQLYLVLSRGESQAGSLALGTLARLVSSLQRHTLGVRLLPSWLFQILLVALFVAVYRQLRDRRQRLLLLGLCMTAALQLLAVTRRSSVEAGTGLIKLRGSDRYYGFLKAFLFWLCACALLTLLARVRPRVRWAVLTVMMLVPAVTSGFALQRHAFPSREWAEPARRLEAGEAMDVEIHPGGKWRVQLPAARDYARGVSR
jgi:hypothetical protein